MNALRIALLALALPATALGADAAAGKSLYTAKCVACHGADGKGNGPASGALPVKPADFTTAAFWATRDAASVKNILQNGTPGGVMRPFPMEEAQLADIVAYVQTFKPK